MSKWSPDSHPRDHNGKFTGVKGRGTQRALPRLKKIAESILPKADKKRIADRKERDRTQWGKFGSEAAYNAAYRRNPNDPEVRRLHGVWTRG